MECHLKWNVSQNGMSLKWIVKKMECHSKLIVTSNVMSFKRNVTQNKISLRIKCH